MKLSFSSDTLKRIKVFWCKIINQKHSKENNVSNFLFLSFLYMDTAKIRVFFNTNSDVANAAQTTRNINDVYSNDGYNVCVCVF